MRITALQLRQIIREEVEKVQEARVNPDGARIDWDAFDENSSSAESLGEFVRGEISLKDLEIACWSSAAMIQARNMARFLGEEEARRQAKLWFRRQRDRDSRALNRRQRIG